MIYIHDYIICSNHYQYRDLHVCSGGKWVRVSERMYAKYFVAQKPKTYRFRLTIWDPKNKDRKDYDFVNVDIMGGMAVSYIMYLYKCLLV